MTLIRGGDATPNVGTLDLDAPWSSRAAMSDAIPVAAARPWAAIPPPRPRFAAMVPLAVRVPPKARNLLGILFASAFPMNDAGCEVLRPLWAEEAMHRVFGFLRLVQALGGRGEQPGEPPVVASLADAVAGDLAARFRELEASGEREVQPCSEVLRDVVTGIGTLFGEPANVTLKTKIEDVLLPGYKRRALVLVAVELVSNALLHAFVGREAGRIDVELTTTGLHDACLRVTDNGIGFTDLPPNLECGVAAGLADLLEADLAYDRLAGRTIAEIAFPVAALWHGH